MYYFLLFCQTGIIKNYHIYTNYYDKQPQANSVGPDQNAASDLGIHCLSFVQQFLDISIGSKMDLCKFSQLW